MERPIPAELRCLITNDGLRTLRGAVHRPWPQHHLAYRLVHDELRSHGANAEPYDVDGQHDGREEHHEGNDELDEGDASLGSCTLAHGEKT